MQRRRILIWLAFFLLFIFEGAVFPWIIPVDWQSKAGLIPHLVLVGVFYLSIYANRHEALLFGLFFGLLQDIAYYGHMLGPHSFCMGMAGYLTNIAIRRIHIHLMSTLTIMALGSFIYDATIYGIYRLFQVISVPFAWTVTHQILPTMLIAVLTALLLYVPARQYLEVRRLENGERAA